MFIYILGYSSDAKNTFLKTALFYKDKPTNCTINAADGDTSSGYRMRKNHVTKSQTCPFVTSLHIDFLNSSKWLPPGLNLRLKFIRNDDDFVILANAANGTYKIKLLQLYVEFRKISVDVPIMKREMDLLDKGQPYVMPFLQGKHFIHTIPEGRLSYMLDDLCTGRLPKQLLVSFVAHDSYNGALKKNGFVFENININSLVYKVNGENSPPMEYKPKFDAKPKDCLRGENALVYAMTIILLIYISFRIHTSLRWHWCEEIEFFNWN